MPREITIDASGRLVLPKDVRTRHRLSAGSKLALIEEDDRLVLVARRGEPVAVEQGGILVFRGRLEGQVDDHRELRERRLERF